MAWRFNAPPGWPVPPDFVPPQGWVPDPAWPPAPAGWTYWVEAPAPGTWGDPYLAAAPVYGAAPGYGVPPGYPSAPGYGPPAPKRGLPGWVIGLIAAGVAFAVLSVIGVLVVGGLLVAGIAGSGFAESLAASEACDTAAAAFVVPSTPQDPVRAGFQARTLASARDSADIAASFDDAYVRLRDDIAAAQQDAQEIADLPRDTSQWTAEEQAAARAAQARLDAAGERISRTCSTIDDPFEEAVPVPVV